eukprot:scaffold8353_cov85-Skeletonema_dohrnii-CCMP3373.AAC.1
MPPPCTAIEGVRPKSGSNLIPSGVLREYQRLACCTQLACGVVVMMAAAWRVLESQVWVRCTMLQAKSRTQMKAYNNNTSWPWQLKSTEQEHGAEHARTNPKLKLYVALIYMMVLT